MRVVSAFNPTAVTHPSLHFVLMSCVEWAEDIYVAF